MESHRGYIAQQSLRCHQCSMVFTTIQQLSKHRAKFCVGSGVDEKYKPYVINDDKQLAEEKIRQLRSLKVANARRNEEINERDRLVVSQAGLYEKDYNHSQLGRQLNHQESERLKLSEADDQAAIAELRNQINSLRSNLMRDDSRVPLQYETEQTLQPLQLSQLQQQPQQQPQHSHVQGLSTQRIPRFNFSGGSLATEVRSLRQHYIDTGGKDPHVIDQLSEMLQDAEMLERRNQPVYNTRQPPRSVRSLPPSYPNTEELMAMEMENYRLQRELIMLENNKRETLSRPGGYMDVRLQQLEQDHMARIVSLERELELSRHQALLDATRRDVRQDVRPHQPDHLNSYYKPVSHITNSSYSAAEGFVCFYDFLMGLESTDRHCKLVVGLYNNIVEFGEPSPLPTVYTEMFQGGNTAMIGARQPVPQCPPSKDLGLVVELQTSDSTPNNLRTKAWLKLDLFNDKRNLRSGAWKIEFRCPPIRPDLATSALTSLPPYSNSTLYMRVVNQRDSHKQSEAIISPANYVDYHIPQITANVEQTPYSWDT